MNCINWGKHNSKPIENETENSQFLMTLEKRNKISCHKYNNAGSTVFKDPTVDRHVQKSKNYPTSSNGKDMRISSTTTNIKEPFGADCYNEPTSTTNGKMLPPNKFQSINQPKTHSKDDRRKPEVHSTTKTPSPPPIFTDMTEAKTGACNQKPTSPNQFHMNDDVLVEESDEKYYLGTVVGITGNNQYLVKFDDNTQKWCTGTLMKHFGGGNSRNDSPLCVSCKEKRNLEEVVVCTNCGRGYHENCASENPSMENFSKNWSCERCRLTDEIDHISISSDEEVGENEWIEQAYTNKSQLPYVFDSLKWDNRHRVNQEQIYCYCGNGGNWDTKMLQCIRCEQWFHEKCISSNKIPLIDGDCFYIFSCSICNCGKEFLQRLHMSWNELIHLVLFNLSKSQMHKYHDVYKTVAPFILNNWDLLQLPGHMNSYRDKASLQSKILLTVKNDKKFKCGSEVKKKIDLYCLRVEAPPNLDDKNISIPPNVLLSVDLLNNLGIKFITGQAQISEKSKILKMPEVVNEIDDNDGVIFEAPSTSTIAEIQKRKYIRKSDTPKTSTASEDVHLLEKKRKSEAFVNSRLRKRSATISERPTALRTITKSTKSVDRDIEDFSDGSSTKSTFDQIFPAPQNFQGKNNPFHPFHDRATEGFCIVRTYKRKLSASDIYIGSNQQVKKRRGRRCKSGDREEISTTIQPNMPMQSYLPIRDYSSANMTVNSGSSTPSSSSSLSSSSMFSLASTTAASTIAINDKFCKNLYNSIENRNNKFLRQRKYRLSISESVNGVINSPIKSDCINKYFGGLSRIESGERYRILTKRHVKGSTVPQYLLEWEDSGLVTPTPTKMKRTD